MNRLLKSTALVLTFAASGIFAASGDEVATYSQRLTQPLLPRTPLNAKVTERIARDGYRVEKIIFESRPGVYVTGLLFLPDAAKFKPPYRAYIVPFANVVHGALKDYDWPELIMSGTAQLALAGPVGPKDLPKGYGKEQVAVYGSVKDRPSFNNGQSL